MKSVEEVKYESPQIETIELEVESIIASSGNLNDFEDGGDA